MGKSVEKVIGASGIAHVKKHPLARLHTDRGSGVEARAGPRAAQHVDQQDILASRAPEPVEPRNLVTPRLELSLE